MENDNRFSRRNRNKYNEDWDAHADRDRYERDYYQNRRYRPQGYSYNADRDMYGSADYNRYGTGYTGNDYHGYPEDSNYYNDRHGQRMGSGYRQGDSDWRYGTEFNRGDEGFRDSGYHRDHDFERRVRYGYNENPNYGYYDRQRRRDDYWNRNDRNRGDRNWWDRTTDEVASWFGDDDAERRRERDQRMDYRGKGPKGYSRSDEQIKSDLEDELYNDSYIDASDMVVSVEDAVVTLSGSVDSKWIKRRAEDMAETVNGVKDVKVNLTVRRESQRNPNDYYSDSDSGNRPSTGTGTMTSNTSHKTGNTAKAKS